MSVLCDNRKYQAMTVEEADALFLDLARHKAAVEREAARYKQRLAELEAAHREKIALDVAAVEALEQELGAYIRANPARFLKPRKHQVGQIGSYGITTDPAVVKIEDKAAFVAFALEQGYDDLCRVERTPDKDAAAKRIAAGEVIPGARLIPAGDVVKLAFRKGFAEQLEG